MIDALIKYAMLVVVIAGIIGLGLLELAGLLVSRLRRVGMTMPTQPW